MLRTALTSVLLTVASLASVQARTDDRTLHLRLEYQFIKTGEVDTSVGPVDVGETDAHVALVSAVYSLGKRWTLFGSLPYVRKRHRGAAVHDANVDFVAYTPPDLRVVDDGNYHGGVQDLYLGVQYHTTNGPFSISPYVSFGAPVSNYPVYGNAIIGKHLWELPLGVSIGFTPYFSDWHFMTDISYVISEEVMDLHLDYWVFQAAISYYVTPQFVPRVFFVKRYAPHALDFPEDFTDDFTFSTPEDFDTESYYHHDRTMKHAYLNAGLGVDYVVSDRLSIHATWFQTLDPDTVARVESAYTFALTHRF